MRRFLLVAVLMGLPAFAAELAGVKVPDTASVDGKELKINGIGIRRKFIFDVYVAALYVENTNKDGAKILAADEYRRVDMKMLRDLDKKTIGDAMRTSIENGTADKGASVKDRLDKFIAGIPDLKKGQSLTIVYVPGKGTRIDGTAGAIAVEGKDFADGLFGVWIGAKPVDDVLKKGMLGN